MELTVKERMVLLNVLPREGSYVTLKLARELREDLSFGDEENKALGFTYEGNQVRWDDEAEADVGKKDVKVPETMLKVILSTFQELDAAEKLNMDHLELYERAMELDAANRDVDVIKLLDQKSQADGQGTG